MGEYSDPPEVRRKIRDVLTAAFAAAAEAGDDPDLAGWTVHYTWPGDRRTDRDVILGRISGSEDQTAFGGDLMPREDKYTIPVICIVRGEIGAGHKVKLVNNMLSLGYGMVTAEALLAAKKGGIDLKALREVEGIRLRRVDDAEDALLRAQRAQKQAEQALDASNPTSRAAAQALGESVAAHLRAQGAH